MTAATAKSAHQAVWSACCTIVGKEDDAPLDADASLFDLGIDSLGLAELVIQLEEAYGEGCITIDDVMAGPVVSQIAAKLPHGSAVDVKPAAAPAPKLAPKVAQTTTTVKNTPPAAVVAPSPAGLDSSAARAIFFFCGEGAHSAAGVDLTVLKTSPAWAIVDAALKAQHGTSAEEFLTAHLGNHAPPHSPVVTTILNIVQADLWRSWGRTRPPPDERSSQ